MHLCIFILICSKCVVLRHALLWCMWCVGDDSSDLPHYPANVNHHLLHATYPTEAHFMHVTFTANHICQCYILKIRHFQLE